MRLLVLRFSALGDVMMGVPLVDALARRYPDLDITVLSRRQFIKYSSIFPVKSP